MSAGDTAETNAGGAQGPALTLPPAFEARGAPIGVDPFAAACDAAIDGAEPGLLLLGLDPSTIACAVVLAPEEPLASARTVLFAAEQALTDALGALGPPELAVRWIWPDALDLNGALAGRARLAAPPDAASDAAPDWLVVGVELAHVRQTSAEPGLDISRTSLSEEGAGDVGHGPLIEAWCRHFLRWVHERETGGSRALNEGWLGRAVGREAPLEVAIDVVNRRAGRVRALDDEGGLFLDAPAGAPPPHLLLPDALDRLAACGGLDAFVPYLRLIESPDA